MQKSESFQGLRPWTPQLIFSRLRRSINSLRSLIRRGHYLNNIFLLRSYLIRLLTKIKTETLPSSIRLPDLCLPTQVYPEKLLMSELLVPEFVSRPVELELDHVDMSLSLL